MHKPRTMVMIAEQNIGRDGNCLVVGARGEQTDISVVENAFMDKFTKKGFEFIDHQIAIKKIRGDRGLPDTRTSRRPRP